MEAALAKPRLASLLEHFSRIGDDREPWRVVYPLPEALLLVVCATIAGCDDYDEIADWGEAHLSFLRGLSEFCHGVPCEDWLRSLMNRIDPALFSACFTSWARATLPASPASQTSRPSPWSRLKSKSRAKPPAPSDDYITSADLDPERLARGPSVPTGPSKTPSTGSSMLPSKRTSQGSGPAMAPQAWLS